MAFFHDDLKMIAPGHERAHPSTQASRHRRRNRPGETETLRRLRILTLEIMRGAGVKMGFGTDLLGSLRDTSFGLRCQRGIITWGKVLRNLADTIVFHHDVGHAVNENNATSERDSLKEGHGFSRAIVPCLSDGFSRCGTVFCAPTGNMTQVFTKCVHNEPGGCARHEEIARQDRAVGFASVKQIWLPSHHSKTGDTRHRGLHVAGSWPWTNRAPAAE